MIKVIIESPYAGNVKRNIEYLKLCMKDCIKRGEVPFAGHLLYTQVLDDNIQEERNLGIQFHLEWIKFCDKVIVYDDFGISDGMMKGIEFAKECNKEIIYRSLDTYNVYITNVLVTNVIDSKRF